jgi:hypothetical protein
MSTSIPAGCESVDPFPSHVSLPKAVLDVRYADVGTKVVLLCSYARGNVLQKCFPNPNYHPQHAKHDNRAKLTQSRFLNLLGRQKVFIIQ